MNTVNNEEFSSIMDFDDEMDCACVSDEDFQKALEELENDKSTAEEEVDEGEDDVIDTQIEYYDSIPGADIVDMDADDMIAAARDIEFNPFEDDEIMDAAEAGAKESDDIDFDDDED